MYDLIKINEKTYYLNSPSRMGIYSPDGKNAYAIDTGNGDTSAKKLLSAVSSLGMTLTAIFNTHSHGDHDGGNALCQKRTGCKAYSSFNECPFVNTPTLEPVYLFGGFAPKKLYHSFFTAAPSVCSPITEDILPEGLEVIPLPGHSFDHIGFRTAEGVVFPGDAIVSADTIEKYGITCTFDIAAALDSLERLCTLDGTLFIPSHADATSDIKPLAQKNIAAIKDVIEFVTENLRTPKSFDDIMSDAFLKFNIEMNDAQYALLGFTLRSYLVYCENSGLLTHYYADTKMLWKTL